jgi:hypothetical protein
VVGAIITNQKIAEIVVVLDVSMNMIDLAGVWRMTTNITKRWCLGLRKNISRSKSLNLLKIRVMGV